MSEDLKKKTIKRQYLSGNLAKNGKKTKRNTNQTLSRTSRVKVIEYIERSGIQPNDVLPTEAVFMEMLGGSRIKSLFI